MPKKHKDTKKSQVAEKGKAKKQGAVTKKNKKAMKEAETTTRAHHHKPLDVTDATSPVPHAPKPEKDTDGMRGDSQERHGDNRSSVDETKSFDDFPLAQLHDDFMCHMVHIGNIIELSCHHLRKLLMSDWVSDTWQLPPHFPFEIPVPPFWQ